jgi:hypothetical protein
MRSGWPFTAREENPTVLTRYRIEIKYGLITLALLEGLIALDRTQALSGLDTMIADLFDLMSKLGFVGVFVVAVIGNATLLAHIPYTVPLLSLAMSGASLDHLLLMGVASGLGAACGELASYGITLKIVGENPALERSALLQWVNRIVNSHPRMIPLLLFVYAVSPLPDDTVIIPLAMVRYGFRKISPPLFAGKIIHNLGIVTLFYYFSDWSADRISTTVQADLALGLLILLVMIIAYQIDKSRVPK